MIKTVEKLKKGLKGEITIPADKSVSHRAVMFSAISNGEGTIKNFSSGADCHSTLNIFKQLGADIKFKDEKTLFVKSNGILNPSKTDIRLDAGNSGTTTRLISGILARQNFNSTIIGDASLSKRPMKRVIEPLTLMGAKIEAEEGHLPMKIYGRKLNGIIYTSKLASAQVKSCVLLAGLGAEGKTVFSEPYLSRNHTELLLDYLGADIKTEGTEVTIYPSKLSAKDITVIGDISSAAFFITAGLIVKGSDFVIKNVGLNPTRAGIIDIVKRMGGGVDIINKTTCSGEEVGDIRVQYNDSLKGCIIEGDDIPRLIDELPVIAVLASQAEGETIVKNAEDLRNKESDRIKCLTEELKKIGVNIEETTDGFIVHGKSELRGGAELESYHDHRLAMSFYIAGLVSKEKIGINGFEWTKISFPEFEELFALLS